MARQPLHQPADDLVQRRLQVPALNPGNLCPKCETGKVYYSLPRTLVRQVGQAQIAATVCELTWR